MKVLNPVIDSPLLTAREAAGLLRLSPRKLFLLTKKGEVPVVRFDRAVRYSRDDLLKVIEQRKTGGAVDGGLQSSVATTSPEAYECGRPIGSWCSTTCEPFPA
jgi:hypothetical protein